ncbi:MAG: diguanylate cyclase [Burkholderiales bacterium]|nr:MAG: diguanylate cyclase [Burkholderiales bacterium]
MLVIGRRWIRGCCAALLLAALAHGQAEPLTVVPAPGGLLGRQAEVLVEPGAPLRLDEAQAAWQRGEFSPGRRAVLAEGLGSRPIWQRLTLYNPTWGHVELHLVAGMTWIDRVDVYLTRESGPMTQWQGGDELVGAPFAQPGLGMVFPLVVPPGHSELWVRTETPDPMLVPLRLLDDNGLRQLERLQHYGYGLLYGFLLALMAYNAVLFVGVRIGTYLRYSVYLLSFIFVNQAYTGHGLVWLWPDWPALQRYVILSAMVLFGVAGLAFSTSFLEIPREAPRVGRALAGLQLLGVVGMATCAMLDAHEPAVWLGFGFVALAATLIVLLGLWSWRRRQPAAGYFLAAALCGMGGTLSTTLSTWGGLPWSETTFHAIDVGLMVEATLLALALGARMRVQEQARERAEELARTDPLTGLLNRRAFRELASSAHAAAERRDRPLSLLLLDLDHFKAINDTHGHAAGDAALRAVGALLRSTARVSDLCARWGGEEFLLLLPETDHAEARAFAERLRQAVWDIVLTHDGRPIGMTASLGVAQRQPQQSLDALIAAADAALYAAKEAGRNRVECEVIDRAGTASSGSAA